MKFQEVAKLSDKEIGSAVEEQKATLGNIKHKIASNEEKNTAMVKKTRKTIARMLTVLNERDRHDRKKK